ncbi:hypothetical protein ARMGADRAFT_1143840, partial [Armillaria gallica]
PSLSHDYLLPLSDLSTEFCTPVIVYDQIGNSRLTHLPSKSPLWPIKLFINRLVNLLSTCASKTGSTSSVPRYFMGWEVGSRVECAKAAGGIALLYVELVDEHGEAKPRPPGSRGKPSQMMYRKG